MEKLDIDWSLRSLDLLEVRKKRRTFFVSNNAMGCSEWRLDVRRFVSDKAKSASELVPLIENVELQAANTKLVVFRYWQKAENSFLSADIEMGCEEEHRFDSAGGIVLEIQSDVQRIEKAMRNLSATCGCKGPYTTLRCSCVKRKTKCIGCQRDRRSCHNIAAQTIRILHGTSEMFTSEEREGEMEVDCAGTSEPRFESNVLNPPTLGAELELKELENLFSLA